MKNSIWNGNMAALEKYQPALKKIIDEKIKDLQEEIDVQIEEAYTGEQVTVVITKEGKYYLAGKYYPAGIAERLIEKYKNAEFGSLLCVIGLSDGRFLNGLSKVIRKEVMLLVYEPSVSLFLHTITNYDCTELFAREGVSWIVGKAESDIMESVIEYLITADNMLKTIPIIQGNYENIFYDEVKLAVSTISKKVQTLRVHWNTWIKFSGNTIENILKNGKYVYNHYSVNALYDTLPEDVPAIIVAAGPSLDKNIEQLKNAQGKACIIACDTALKPLLNRGVIPDIFFIVDPSKPFELFDNPLVWDIPVVTGINIPHNILDSHKGKKIFCKDNYYMQEMFEYVFGDEINSDKHIMTDLPTGGSVATSAFSAARLMGAKNIVLIGQDLALTSENEHAAGTFKNDRKRSEMRADYLEVVKDIYGNDVKTTKDFNYYLNWYGQEIAKYPEVNVVDATEGGALIKGTVIMTLQEAIDKYCKTSFDVKQYFEQIPMHFNDSDKQKAIEFMHAMPERFEKIRSQIKDGKKWYSELKKCVKNKSYDVKEVQRILKKVKKVNTFMENESLAELIMNGLKQEEYIVRTNLYSFQDDEQKDLLESAQMGLRLMERMDETLEKMWPDIEELGNFKGINV